MRFRVLPVVLLLGLAWICARVPFLVTSLIVLTDSLAHAFRWIGVTDPGPSWVLLGVLGGALLGALVGLWRAGRPVSGRVARRTAAAAGVGMLVAGSYPPPNTAPGWGGRTRAAAVQPGVHLAVERVPLRAAASAGAATTAVLPPRTRLRVTATSSDGNWALVETVDRVWRRGWVLAASLTSDTVASVRPRVADRPPRAPSAADPPVTSASGGEVEGLPPESNPTATAVGEPAQVPAGAAEPPDRVPPAPPAPAAPAVGDRAAVADVRARLASARAASGAGDYAAALRALAAADEGVTLAAAQYGEPAWVAALRREAAGARAAVRSACEGAASLAARRGGPPPRCD